MGMGAAGGGVFLAAGGGSGQLGGRVISKEENEDGWRASTRPTWSLERGYRRRGGGREGTGLVPGITEPGHRGRWGRRDPATTTPAMPRPSAGEGLNTLSSTASTTSSQAFRMMARFHQRNLGISRHYPLYTSGPAAVRIYEVRPMLVQLVPCPVASVGVVLPLFRFPHHFRFWPVPALAVFLFSVFCFPSSVFWCQPFGRDYMYGTK